MDNAKTTGELIIVIASVGYLMAWFILVLHREVIRGRPLVQRRVKYALCLLLVVDTLVGIGIYATAERPVRDYLWVIQALPFYIGVLALLTVSLCVLDKARTVAESFKNAAWYVLWGTFVAFSVLAFFRSPILLCPLLLFLGIDVVMSFAYADEPGRSEKFAAWTIVVFHLSMGICATTIFFLGNLILFAID